MKFRLGQTIITQTALDYCAANNVDALLMLVRHARGDWGDLGAPDKLDNEIAIKEGTRLFSCYNAGGAKFYVITEWDRSYTTLMLASDY